MTAKRSSINGNITNIENSSFQTSNVLTYNWYNDNHNVTAMLGHEYVTKWTRNFMAELIISRMTKLVWVICH